MSREELVAEIRAAASSLVTAAAATENGDLVAAEIGVEDAQFRVESLLSCLRQAQMNPRSFAASGNSRQQTQGQLSRKSWGTCLDRLVATMLSCSSKISRRLPSNRSAQRCAHIVASMSSDANSLVALAYVPASTAPSPEGK